MKVWDTFVFNDELDMLECRLREDLPVDFHILVEAPVTFRGRRKPLTFAANRGRFEPWLGKIVHVVAEHMPKGPDPWLREAAQREYIRRGLVDAVPDDIVLHGDLDEIPSAQGIEDAIKALDSYTTVAFEQRCAVFAVDWVHPIKWQGTVAARYKDIQGFLWMRNQRREDMGLIKNGGWHLSWLGGPDEMRRKTMAFSHFEMEKTILVGIDEQKYYERGLFWGWSGSDEQLDAVDVDSTWPKWVAERQCPASWFRPRKVQ